MDDLFRKLLHPKAYIAHSDANDVIALYKPCDIRSIPNQSHSIDPRSLIHAPYDFKQHCYLLPNHPKFFPLNRLDAPTSGLLIGCFSEAIANAIRLCFHHRTVQKTYCALVRHKKMPSTGEFRDFLNERFDHNHLRVARGKGEQAITQYSIEKALQLGESPIIKLCLKPITGRTHQLRVQCALRKIPIIGDKTYGDFTLNKKLWPILPQKRLHLQSYAIAFPYYFQGKQHSFSFEIPQEF